MPSTKGNKHNVVSTRRFVSGPHSCKQYSKSYGQNLNKFTLVMGLVNDADSTPIYISYTLEDDFIVVMLTGGPFATWSRPYPRHLH